MIFGTLPPTLPSNYEVLSLPTIQPSEVGSLLAWTTPVANEKDRLLEVFFEFCSKVLQPSCPHFYDYIDPSSGLPMLHPSQKVYDEVESMCTLLKVPKHQAGGCKVFLHPKYGEGGYPATCFFVGPRDEVKRWVEGMVAYYNGGGGASPAPAAST